MRLVFWVFFVFATWLGPVEKEHFFFLHFGSHFLGIWWVSSHQSRWLYLFHFFWGVGGKVKSSKYQTTLLLVLSVAAAFSLISEWRTLNEHYSQAKRSATGTSPKS